MENFATRLVSLRKERSLTQADISKLIGKARTSVQGYETEGKEPDYKTLCFLADYFGVTTDYLLGRSDERTHDEAVFANDTQNFAALYADLPAPLKNSVGSAFDSFYLLLARDMRARREEHLGLYAELLTLLQRERADIKNKVASAAVDPVFLADLVSSQSALKNDVSVLLDRLMQADMGVSSKKGESTEKTAI